MIKVFKKRSSPLMCIKKIAALCKCASNGHLHYRSKLWTDDDTCIVSNFLFDKKWKIFTYSEKPKHFSNKSQLIKVNDFIVSTKNFIRALIWCLQTSKKCMRAGFLILLYENCRLFSLTTFTQFSSTSCANDGLISFSIDPGVRNSSSQISMEVLSTSSFH